MIERPVERPLNIVVAAVEAAPRPHRSWREAVQQRRDDVGMATAEYAVGTVAACGFAGILYKLLTSDKVTTLLTEVIKRAIMSVF